MKKLLFLFVLIFSTEFLFAENDSSLPDNLDCVEISTEYAIYYTRNLWPLDALLYVKCDNKIIKTIDIKKSEQEIIVGKVYRDLILQGYVIKSCERYCNRCYWEQIN